MDARHDFSPCFSAKDGKETGTRKGRRVRNVVGTTSRHTPGAEQSTSQALEMMEWGGGSSFVRELWLEREKTQHDRGQPVASHQSRQAARRAGDGGLLKQAEGTGDERPLADKDVDLTDLETQKERTDTPTEVHTAMEVDCTLDDGAAKEDSPIYVQGRQQIGCAVTLCAC